jgi:hypothetical protein
MGFATDIIADGPMFWMMHLHDTGLFGTWHFLGFSF